jgi:hypothetical protein
MWEIKKHFLDTIFILPSKSILSYIRPRISRLKEFSNVFIYFYDYYDDSVNDNNNNNNNDNNSLNFHYLHVASKVVGLERGPLSLVSTTEELLDRKVAAPV